MRRSRISRRSYGSDSNEEMNVDRLVEVERVEEEDQFSKIEERVGGGSGSITINLAFHAECLDPNCSYSHSSAELFLHQRGTLKGFFLLRYTLKRNPARASEVSEVVK